MRYLLDTNVISELRKSAARVSKPVVNWVAAHSGADLHLSVISIVEIEWGIARIERRDAVQAGRLSEWLAGQVLGVFANRILPVDIPVARCAARLHVPDPRPERDAYIAATAVVHEMTVVTRNVADFERMGAPIINPWEG